MQRLIRYIYFLEYLDYNYLKFPFTFLKVGLIIIIESQFKTYLINIKVQWYYNGQKYNINGVIISNTTNQNREKLLDSKKDEVGGLSGQPIKNISTNLIKKFYKELNRKITIIGVGGIDSGKSAFEKITAGADVIQLYTGMVYRGPGVVKEIKKELISILKNDKIKNISDAVGINT